MCNLSNRYQFCFVDLQSNDDDDIIPQDIDCTPAARCSRGEHDPVLDDQIGIKCRYCSAVILEIEDILPPFVSNEFCPFSLKKKSLLTSYFCKYRLLSLCCSRC